MKRLRFFFASILQSPNINCAYTILPTIKGGCPVNIEYSKSVVAAQSSTKAAEAPTKTSAPAPSPSPDMDSEAYKQCGSDLGASECPAANRVCLLWANKDCQTCALDCQKTSGYSPSNDPPDMESEACQKCMGDLGASDCKADEPLCLVNECEHDSWCVTCRLDCSATYGTIDLGGN